MLITIDDNVYDINKIEDEKAKIEANVFIGKANHHRVNAEGSQILVNTYENGLTILLQGIPEALVESKRARDKEGKFIPDDLSTPDVNEAWEGGKKPTNSK
tara:strand:+ start:72 stop:374 length:303 start_codon:yes stop_codon:yes gene_type:complete